MEIIYLKANFLRPMHMGEPCRMWMRTLCAQFEWLARHCAPAYDSLSKSYDALCIMHSEVLSELKSGLQGGLQSGLPSELLSELQSEPQRGLESRLWILP